jgi:hypothetical protein
LKAIIDQAKQKLLNYDIRVAFVGYSDFGESIEKIDFTSDIDAVVNFIDDIKLKGGGD